jgi:adenylate cyclase
MPDRRQGDARPAPTPADDLWRQILVENPGARRRRRLHRAIPRAPRCKLCLSPFGAPGYQVMRFFGHPRWAKNPKYCAGCFRMLESHHGGAEIDCSLLFADVRGSTTLAEGMSAREFNRLMGRFHDVAFDSVVDRDGFVDKFVGDEIIGIFVPALTGTEHADRALDAARELLRRTGNVAGRAPWLPVGAAVASGIAYVGSVGQGPDTDLTAMGDLVNTAARLASDAGAGEVLLTAATAERVQLPDDLERRHLPLKGKSEPTEVVVVTQG